MDKLARDIMLVKLRGQLRWQARNRVFESWPVAIKELTGLVRCLNCKLHDPSYRLAPSVENWLLRIAATAIQLAAEELPLPDLADTPPAEREPADGGQS